MFSSPYKLKIILFFLNFVSFAFAQTPLLDSLLKVVEQNVPDSVRIRAYADASKEVDKIDHDRAGSYAKQAHDLALKCKDQKWMIVTYGTLAAFEQGSGNLEKAEQLFLAAINSANKQKRYASVTMVSNNLAMLYQDMNRYDDAIKTYMTAIEGNKKAGKEGDLARNYNNLGNAYREQEMYDMGLKYYLLSLDIRERIKDSSGISSCYKNMAIVYEQLKRYDESMKMYRIALGIDSQLKNKKGVATVYNNMAVLFIGRKMYDSAIPLLDIALKLREELKHKSSIARTLLNLAQAHSAQHKYKEAEKYLLRALPYTKESNDQGALMMSYAELATVSSGNKKYGLALEYSYKTIIQARKIGQTEVMVDAYRSMAQLYNEKGDPQNAYDHFLRYSQIKDSTENNTKEKTTADMLGKYEAVKKDKELIAKKAELSLQEADNKQKVMQRNAFVGGFVLMLGLAFFIFRGYRQKQKANHIITAQKEEVEKQKALVEEHQKEIIDSIRYAKRIQTAHLPNESVIKKNIDRLKK
jgi:tetratricopeptide (TPR) repeat protein